MSEKISTTNKTKISDANKDYYSQYKETVDRAERRKEWLEDKSLKGVIKRATSKAFKKTMDRKIDDDLYYGPRFAAKIAKRHLKENEEAIKLDAIQDFYDDPANAGKTLNLPKNGLPETVTNVQPFPNQEMSYISDANKDYYSQYKETVDRAERRKEWLEDKSLKGVIKRATSKAFKKTMDRKIDDDLYYGPRFAAKIAKRHLKENEEAIKLDAIQDFYDDPANAGKTLNLPKNGLPETVTNVQPFPNQEQKDK